VSALYTKVETIAVNIAIIVLKILITRETFSKMLTDLGIGIFPYEFE
jgi:hypothetical protein